MKEKPNTPKNTPEEPPKVKSPALPAENLPKAPEEIGGRGGLDPVRYGDWEIGGKCVDF